MTYLPLVCLCLLFTVTVITGDIPKRQLLIICLRIQFMILTAGYAQLTKHEHVMNIEMLSAASQQSQQTYRELALITYHKYYCLGFIIDERVVLTVATCFQIPLIEGALVRVGANTANVADGEVLAVKKIKTHEFYQHSCQTDNDIALVFLKNSISIMDVMINKFMYTGVQNHRLSMMKNFHIVTLGKKEGDPHLPNIVRKLAIIEAVFLEWEYCYRFFGALFAPSTFCAIFNDHSLDVIGSPAVHNRRLVGMVIAIDENNNHYGKVVLLTKTSIFSKWVEKNIMEYNKEFPARNLSTTTGNPYSVKPDLH